MPAHEKRISYKEEHIRLLIGSGAAAMMQLAHTQLQEYPASARAKLAADSSIILATTLQSKSPQRALLIYCQCKEPERRNPLRG